jgi:hypothetical protein
MQAIKTIEMGHGWVIFKIEEPRRARAETTTALNDTMHDYLTQKRLVATAALPFVSGGETVAVHLWTKPAD